jgi:hypothetical protein
MADAKFKAVGTTALRPASRGAFHEQTQHATRLDFSLANLSSAGWTKKRLDGTVSLLFLHRIRIHMSCTSKPNSPAANQGIGNQGSMTLPANQGNSRSIRLVFSLIF